MLQPLSATSRVMKIGISSKEMSLLDLSMTTYWKIRFRLLRVPGVANVPIWGERLKQLQIQVDPERMRLHDVSLKDVMEAASGALDFGLLLHTSRRPRPRPSGSSRLPTNGSRSSPSRRSSRRKHLAKVPIELEDGKTVRLGDVANGEVGRAVADR